MKFYTIAIVCCTLNILNATQLPAQTMGNDRDKFKESIIELRSINPSDTNFSDLKNLQAAIGDARVVMLGEQHTYGANAEANTRLVKFLHQQMGFDVVVFEASMYDCNYAWKKMKAGEPVGDWIKKAIYPIWWKSKQFQPFIEYLRQAVNSPNPLELAGIDKNIEIRSFFIADVQDMIRQIRSFVSDTTFLDSVAFELEKIVSGKYLGRTIPTYLHQTNASKIYDILARVRLQLKLVQYLPAVGDSLQQVLSYWRQILESRESNTFDATYMLDSLTQLYFRRFDEYQKQGKSYRTDTLYAHIAPAERIRDVQMGENLVWLLNNPYKNRKVIVWAANSHIRRKDSSISMGDVVRHYIGKSNVRAIGTTCYDGTEAMVFYDKPQVIEPAPKESIEAMLHEKGYKYALVNLQNLSRSNLHYKWRYEEERNNDASTLVDMLLFIHTMTPHISIENKTENMKK